MGQVTRVLDDEHRANLTLLARVEDVFARPPSQRAMMDPDVARLAGTFGQHLEKEMTRHFDFEERELFPRMIDAGDGGMAALLVEEHDAIRAVRDEILPLARAAANGTLDAAGWQGLQRGSLELVERMISHIQKETMALLPLLDNLLDDETDRELAFAYAAI
jgi:hemerythrin-like domain-containing protein